MTAVVRNMHSELFIGKLSALVEMRGADRLGSECSAWGVNISPQVARHRGFFPSPCFILLIPIELNKLNKGPHLFS